MKTQFDVLSMWLKAHTKSERGASMVEYALLVALIAVIAIAALRALGTQLSTNFSEVTSEIA